MIKFLVTTFLQFLIRKNIPQKKKDRDGILRISHNVPDVPVGHVQLKPFNSSVQNPPLKQRKLAHSSISKIKIKRCNTLKHFSCIYILNNY